MPPQIPWFPLNWNFIFWIYSAIWILIHIYYLVNNKVDANTEHREVIFARKVVESGLTLFLCHSYEKDIAA